MYLLPKRRFGKTELHMSVHTCGGMRYQYTWKKGMAISDIPREHIESVKAIVSKAIEIGINHFETANYYGSSELQLGQALKELQIPRSDVIIQTKIDLTENRDTFFNDFETSLRDLQTDYVDLLTLHGINNEELYDWSMRKNGCADWANQLKQSGLCRHVGFSTHAPTNMICSLIESGQFEYVFLHYYFVDYRNREAVELAQKRDLGVFIISPNDRGGKLFDPPTKLSVACRPLNPMAFNTLHLLAQSPIHSLSLGASCPEDFDAHTETLENYYEIRDEITQPIYANLTSIINNVMGEDWYTNWHIGLPEYLSVPNQINIIEILRLWTFAKVFDMFEFARARYNLLGQGSHWFPGETAATLAQISLSNCIKNSPYADRIPEYLAEAHKNLAGKPVKRLSKS